MTDLELKRVSRALVLDQGYGNPEDFDEDACLDFPLTSAVERYYIVGYCGNYFTDDPLVWMTDLVNGLTSTSCAGPVYDLDSDNWSTSLRFKVVLANDK